VPFNRASRHKRALWEWRNSSTHSPTSAMDEATPLQRKNPPARIGGWAGPRAGADIVVKRKTPSLCRDSNCQSSSPQPSTTPPSYPSSLRSYNTRKLQRFILKKKKQHFKITVSMISWCNNYLCFWKTTLPSQTYSALRIKAMSYKVLKNKISHSECRIIHSFLLS
jgi:hypothetical protein